MEEKITCKIVQDLLPNYTENLLNNETKKYVENHLEKCHKCQNALKIMNENIDENAEQIVQEEINYMKKFNNKMNVLKGLLLIIIIIVMAILGRRVIIIVKLANKAKNIKANNYYVKAEGTFVGEYKINECYFMDGKYVTKITTYNNENGIIKTTFFENGTEHIMIIENNNEKTINQDVVLSEIGLLPRYTENGIIFMALAYGVETTKLGDVECYVLKDKNVEQYINKNTGLLVKQIDRKNNSVTDYQYEFGNVSENDFQDLETPQYKENTKNQETEKNIASVNNVSYSKEYKESDYKELPIEYSSASYAYDTTTPEKAMGVADYAFIGKVTGVLRTEYRFPTTVYSEEGEKVLYTPYTVYSVEIIENIKGELVKTNNIEIVQHGGITSDGEKIELMEGMKLLNAGEYYILLPYTASDGRMGISCSTSIISLGHLSDSERNLISSIDNVKSSINTLSDEKRRTDESTIDVVRKYVKAYANQIIPEGKNVKKSQIYDAKSTERE